MKTDYNQAAFSQLLQLSIGRRKKKEFAAQIGITPEYLSRLLNEKRANVPSKDLLKNIARHSHGNVTYGQLLESCGYTGQNESIFDLSILPSEANKFMKATILTALESLNLPWILESSIPDCDLVITLMTDPKCCWYFGFLSPTSEEQLQDHLATSYLSLLFQSIKAEDKYSLVTCSDTEYKFFLHQVPVNLNLNLSIILIDKDHLTVQEESWLSKSSNPNPSLEQLHL